MKKELFYSIDDLCNILGVGKNTVYILLKNNTIPNTIIAKKYKVPRKIFDSWFEEYFIENCLN